jgi:hypothetical protein
MNFANSAIYCRLALLTTLAFGCTGGVPCPTATYEPVGEILAGCDVEDAQCPRDEGMCVLFCTTNCAQEIAGGCACEPCDHVIEWAEENCPSADCLEESDDGVGWDLALSCTND